MYASWKRTASSSSAEPQGESSDLFPFSFPLLAKSELHADVIDGTTVPSDRPSFRSQRRSLDARRLSGSRAARKSVTGESLVLHRPGPFQLTD